MDINAVVETRQKLNQAAAQRFGARAAAREAKQEAIQQNGVLAAAGLSAAVNRALQLSVAEGRSATMSFVGSAVAPPTDTPAAAIIEPQAAAPLQGARGLEAIVDLNDTDQINFLDHGMRASQSVCRLLYQGQPIGTGFLIAPGLLLTNHHVVGDTESAAGFVAQFSYQLDADDNPLQPTRFALDSSRFVTSGVDDFDFTIVGIRSTSSDPVPLSRFGWLPLNPSTDKILEGEPVVIIQHPQGREKQICLFHSELLDRQNQYVYYSTDTEVGSSGSPAFNRQWQVIALHHASAPSGQMRQGKQTAANEGIRISSIIKSLQDKDRITGDATAILDTLLDPQTQVAGRPTAPITIAPITGGAVTPGLEARTVIETRPPAWYQNPKRQGYDANFLGTRIPLPVLPPALASDATKLVDGSIELKYVHYSSMMCASRKLPYFSVCNLDGATAKSLKRTDRDPNHPQVITGAMDTLEAADRWFRDGRIPDGAQLGAEVYDGTDFDFGHMTRRLDPIWGDDPQLLRYANDDTFLMTNCAPQHKKLNEVTWAAVEDAVYAAATKHKLKFVVMTGPVLDPRDPVIRNVQIPVAFWKVIAFQDGGKLQSMSFLQWQTDLVAQIQKSLESLPELGKAEQWHVPLADIVRLTALDFGPLLAADVKGMTGSREPVTASLIAKLLPA